MWSRTWSRCTGLLHLGKLSLRPFGTRKWQGHICLEIERLHLDWSSIRPLDVLPFRLPFKNPVTSVIRNEWTGWAAVQSRSCQIVCRQQQACQQKQMHLSPWTCSFTDGKGARSLCRSSGRSAELSSRHKLNCPCPVVLNSVHSGVVTSSQKKKKKPQNPSSFHLPKTETVVLPSGSSAVPRKLQTYIVQQQVISICIHLSGKRIPWESVSFSSLCSSHQHTRLTGWSTGLFDELCNGKRLSSFILATAPLSPYHGSGSIYGYWNHLFWLCSPL